MRKNNNKLKCAFRPFKGQLSGKESRVARWEGRIGRERRYGKTRRDFLDNSLLWCIMIQGMKRNLTLD